MSQCLNQLRHCSLICEIKFRENVVSQIAFGLCGLIWVYFKHRGLAECQVLSSACLKTFPTLYLVCARNMLYKTLITIVTTKVKLFFHRHLPRNFKISAWSFLTHLKWWFYPDTYFSSHNMHVLVNKSKKIFYGHLLQKITNSESTDTRQIMTDCTQRIYYTHYAVLSNIKPLIISSSCTDKLRLVCWQVQNNVDRPS